MAAQTPARRQPIPLGDAVLQRVRRWYSTPATSAA